MNRLRYCGRLVALALCVTTAGCSTEFPLAPEVPTIPTVEEHLKGTLTVNGAVTGIFTAGRSGPVDIVVTELSDSQGPAAVGQGGTIRIGLQLGSWNTTVCSVPTFSDDNAFVATVITAAVTGATQLCVRVYDAGRLTEPVDFDIRVNHP